MKAILTMLCLAVLFIVAVFSLSLLRDSQTCEARWELSGYEAALINGVCMVKVNEEHWFPEQNVQRRLL